MTDLEKRSDEPIDPFPSYIRDLIRNWNVRMESVCDGKIDVHYFNRANGDTRSQIRFRKKGQPDTVLFELEAQSIKEQTTALLLITSFLEGMNHSMLLGGFTYE